MNTAQHTPGPWSFEELNGILEIIDETGLGTIAQLLTIESGISEEDIANARLISAAPDMLSALETIASRMSENADGRELYGDWIAIAEEAINKAKGEAK
jgi:hypothetical protein